MTIDHKKMLMIGLLSIALLLWAYHFTRIEIEFPESYSDGVLVCSPEYNTGPGELSEQELAASWEQFVEEALAESANTDARVMAAVIRNDLNVTNRIDELADLIAQYPDNRLANLHFLNACAESAGHPACNENTVVQANTVNGDNAVSWSLLAVYRAELEDDFGVDRAMARAANAPEFDDYFGTQLRIMRDAMPDGSDYQKIGLALNLMGRVRLTFNNSYQISNLCNNDDPLHIGLFQSCLNFGERMQLGSQAQIMTLIGGAIKQVAYRAMGNVEEASTLAEARRLSANPDYAPCRSPGPRIYYRLGSSPTQRTDAVTHNQSLKHARHCVISGLQRGCSTTGNFE